MHKNYTEVIIRNSFERKTNSADKVQNVSWKSEKISRNIENENVLAKQKKFNKNEQNDLKLICTALL